MVLAVKTSSVKVKVSTKASARTSTKAQDSRQPVAASSLHRRL